MPELPAVVRVGGRAPGGIRGYPLGQLTEEVAFLSYYLHWPHDDVMGMEHRDRREWVRQISEINTRVNETV